MNTFEHFKYPNLIREHHLDGFGHVNNATYLQLMEEARWDIVSPKGFSFYDVQKKKMGPTILEIQLKFIKELRLREQIIIHTQGIEYPGKVGTLRQWITNSKDETCTEATFKFGLFDITERKLIRPTPDWLAALGAPPQEK